MPGVRLISLTLTVLFTAQILLFARGEDAIARIPTRQGFLVPLKHHVQPGWRRQLLRHGPLPVLGSTRELGYFYATLSLGTPARSFSLIIDTGSTITYIPCKGCANCGKHQSERFNLDASSTARRLLCDDPLCNCGSPSCMCAANNQCYYKRSYAEGSVSEGFLINDVLNFPDDQPPVSLVFGCVNGERGELFRQMADGLMGMGNNNNAFQSQLVANGVIDDVFSLCFGFPRDGVLLLGDVQLPAGTSPTLYSPLINGLHLHFYNVKLDAIYVHGEKLPLDRAMFDRGYGTVLDSGTTFTYLPSMAFEAIIKVVGEFAEAKGLERCPGADPQYNDICWKGASENFEELGNFFPSAQLELDGDVRLDLSPFRYLFLSRPAEYCLSIFDNGFSGTLIGTGTVQDVLVTYDRRNRRVGFTDISCAKLAASLAKSVNATIPLAMPMPPSPTPPSPAPYPRPPAPAPYPRLPTPRPPSPAPTLPPKASASKDPGSSSGSRKAPPPSPPPVNHTYLHHKPHHHPKAVPPHSHHHVLQQSPWLRLQ